MIFICNNFIHVPVCQFCNWLQLIKIMSRNDTKIFDNRGSVKTTVWLIKILMWALVWPKVNLTILGKCTITKNMPILIHVMCCNIWVAISWIWQAIQDGLRKSYIHCNRILQDRLVIGCNAGVAIQTRLGLQHDVAKADNHALYW